MTPADLLAGLGVGLASGVTSGLLGVSPGGGLVVFSVLLLGVEQHVAQGISLAAQVPPTSLAGLRHYHQKGSRSPLRWLAILAFGSVGGGIAGALAASHASGRVLQWTYVVYLAALDAMLIVRARPSPEPEGATASRDIHGAALLAVGVWAGFSSGFIGIGGGLATTVGLCAGLKVAQRQAQMISLVLSLLPMTLPAALIYWRQGHASTWAEVISVVAGLIIGSDLGARMAHQVGKTYLHRALIFFVSAMTIYMLYKALS